MEVFFRNRTFKSNFTNTILIHIFCWSLFIAYELCTVYYALGKLDPPYVYFIYYPIHIAYFYGYIHILNNTFNAPVKRRYFQGLLQWLLLLFFYLTVKFSTDYLLSDRLVTIRNPFFYIQGLLPRTIGRGLYFTVLATFYWSAGHIAQFRKRAATAETQQAILLKEKAELETLFVKARNAYLQQQMNPHMLFNTLNFIYNKVEDYSEDAARCVWLLSEIMRFSFEDTNREGMVILQQEINQIFNLLEINRYRFDQPLYLEIETNGNFSRYRIIPLILLTLTENIFKHGNLIEAEHPGILKIEINDKQQLHFYSRNLTKPNDRPRTQQVGLQNTRIRLDTVYPGRYVLEIKEQNGFFMVNLILNLCD